MWLNLRYERYLFLSYLKASKINKKEYIANINNKAVVAHVTSFWNRVKILVSCILWPSFAHKSIIISSFQCCSTWRFTTTKRDQRLSMRICNWVITLTLLSTSTIQAKEATYSCSLPTLTFKFYQLSDHYTYDIEVIRGDSVEKTTQTMVDVQGSGPCRHGIWKDDNGE